MKTQTQNRRPNARLKIKVEPFTCDQCRLNKVSCQAPASIDERCGQCEQRDDVCSWEIGPRPLGRSPPSPSYVTYLETQVGKVEQKLREILPGINLNRELETLAQGSPPGLRRSIPTHPVLSGPDTSQSPSNIQGPSPSSPPHTKPPMLVVAPQLLKQVRMGSDVNVEIPLPYTQQSPQAQREDHKPLRKDIYWSATASTKSKEPRFHGQSSGEILLRDAKEFKQECVDLAVDAYDESTSGEVNSERAQSPPKPGRLRQRRPEFWELTVPERRAMVAELWPPNPSLELVEGFGFFPGEVLLPPPDLLRSLVNLFFEYVAPMFPLFHRGMFELELAQGTHLSDVLKQRSQRGDTLYTTGIEPVKLGHKNWHESGHNYWDGTNAGPNPLADIDQTRGAGTFARLVLLVCACASRWSGDPRVLSTGSANASGGTRERGLKEELNSLSAGYVFFRQVNLWNRPTFAQAGLWDVQMYVLAIVFLHGSSAYHSCWLLLGIGTRLAQDIGAHRRREGVSIENELYKRTFWCLIVVDRMMSGAWGRLSAIQDIDIDLDNVIEVDDEHWPLGGQPQQPPGKPSRLSFLNSMCGLMRVLGRALQTVFATDRTKRQLGLVGHENERMLLRDLLHHLKQWQLTVPPHLRLPAVKDFVPSVFLDQAVSIWGMYYQIMIMIHRPFIAVASSPLRADCLRICCSSARACAKILEGHLRLSESEVLPHTLQATFSSAMVLLIDILETRKAQNRDDNARGIQPSPLETSVPADDYPLLEKEADVVRCMEVLRRAETRWHFAGRLHDMLQEFQHSGHLPSPDPATDPSRANSRRPKFAAVSTPLHGSSPQFSATRTTPPKVHIADTFDLDFTPPEPTPSPTPDSRTNTSSNPHPNSSTPPMTSQPPILIPPPKHELPFHRTDSNIFTTHPTSTHTYYPQSSSLPMGFVHSESTSFIHPGPADPYQLDAGAYLPDSYYCGDSNVPFPGIIPGILFAPNNGREDGMGTGYGEGRKI